MANEISLSAQFRANKNGADINPGQFQKTINMVGNGATQLVQNIGSTSEQITLTDITNTGYLAFKNVGTTGTISVSTASPAASATAFATLKPGEFAITASRASAFYAITYSAVSENLLVCACEL